MGFLCGKFSLVYEYNASIYIVGSIGNVPVRNEPDELRTSESCR